MSLVLRQVSLLFVSLVIVNGYGYEEDFIIKYKQVLTNLQAQPSPGNMEDFIRKYKEVLTNLQAQPSPRNISSTNNSQAQPNPRNISTKIYTQGQDFLCTENLDPSPSVPLSVHRLRPADIKVVAAIGDSVTAGFGISATSVINLATEWRGRSWTIGGEWEMTKLVTIPSILQNYKGSLYGYATGTGGPNSENAVFNVAISGAIGKGMPAQANNLIDKMKSNENIDFHNDWKLVSLWIGGNDLCSACRGNNDQLPDTYLRYVREALNILRDGMPRTFVNLIHIIDITKLYAIKSGNCVSWHNLVCSCGTSDDKNIRDLVTEYAEEYQKGFDKLAFEYDGMADFAVVGQPFWKETEIPLVGGIPDKSYFSLDCFHFSEKAHDASAVALWNNMFEPVGQKSTSWQVGELVQCPTNALPYLFTNENSRTYLKEWLRAHNKTQSDS